MTSLLLTPVAVFMLVLARISGTVILLPGVGAHTVPVRVRVLLAVSLAALVTPVQLQTETTVPRHLLEATVLLGGELLLGLTVGLSITLVFSGILLAGYLVGQMSGMQLADVFDVEQGQSTPIFSQLLYQLALAVFLLIGGHRQVMSVMLDLFQWMPPGDVTFSPLWHEMAVELLTRSFSLAVRAAAPVLAALLLSLLIVGIASRTLPQLNILAVGISLNVMVLLASLFISIGAAIWVFHEEVGASLALLRDTLDPSG